MKNYVKALLVGILATTLSIGGVNAASTAKKNIDASKCETVYTNYYFFVDANTSDYLSQKPLSQFKHSTIAEYNNNSYQVKTFNSSNVGYGQVDVTRSTTTSSDGITSMSLVDFYDIFMRAINLSGGSFSSGTKNYIAAHDWYTINGDGSATKKTGGVDLSMYSSTMLAGASLDATSVITTQSTIAPNYENPFLIRIDRSYYGYITGSPLASGNYSWYLQPALYYIQYCTPKKETPVVNPTKEYFTITYDGNGSNVTNVPGVEKDEVGSCITISKQTPIREGYEFLGWGTSKTAVNTDYTPGVSSYCGARGNITLYAIWKKKESRPDPVVNYYTVSYRPNAGSDVVTAMPNPADMTIEDDRDVYIASNVPQRDGYTFIGWHTDANATTALYVAGELYTDRKDIVLYAIWKKNADPVKPEDPIPDNPKTGIEDALLPLGGVTLAAKVALDVMKKKAYKL